MSERERWIIYPLLFFALGAAVRDKILQRVEAKEIVCESLKIVDQQDPARPLAELGFKRAISNDPTQLADRVGRLRLTDSDGNEACDISNDAFFQRLIGRQMLIIDPSRRPLVIVGTEAVPSMMLGDGESTVSYQGVIYLNNRRLGIRLAPPTSPSPATNKPPSPQQ